MGFMNKMLHKDAGAVADRDAATPATCPHVMLVPRWNSASDMGHEDLASSFRCDTCGADFTPDEARNQRHSEASRVVKQEA
jgi:hypothetical protein